MFPIPATMARGVAGAAIIVGLGACGTSPPHLATPPARSSALVLYPEPLVMLEGAMAHRRGDETDWLRRRNDHLLGAAPRAAVAERGFVEDWTVEQLHVTNGRPRENSRWIRRTWRQVSTP